MSTVHRPPPVQIWWYATAALVAVLVGVLALTLLGNIDSSSGSTTAPGNPSAPAGAGWSGPFPNLERS